MIQIMKSTDGQWYFVVLAKNHKVLVTSETYSRKHDAHIGANRLVCLLNEEIEIQEVQD